jgi:hypothetical protein
MFNLLGETGISAVLSVSLTIALPFIAQATEFNLRAKTPLPIVLTVIPPG